MQKNPTALLVVAARIIDQSGRVLLQKALPGKSHAGEWEFPGGKVDSDETPRAALAREIAEELGLAIDQSALVPAGFADQPGGEGRPAIVLFLYTCTEWSGDPVGRDGQEWGWFTPLETRTLRLASLDRVLLAALPAEGPE